MVDLDALLTKTSRTFALAIPLLPEPTRRAVSVSYLLFRIADTFEDATAWARAKRIAALNEFAELLTLEPARRAVQAHALRPTIYVNIEDSDGAETAVAVGGDPNKAEPKYSPAEARLVTDRFRIVRAQRKKNARVVGNLKVTFYGKMSQEQRQVPVTSESMGGGWTKVIPLEPFQPGEYALVEMLGENEINLYVWDFSMDPNAPASTRAWKPGFCMPGMCAWSESPKISVQRGPSITKITTCVSLPGAGVAGAGVVEG